MTEDRYAYAILTDFDKRLPYQLTGAGYRFRQEDINRPFGYPTFQWLLISRGSGTVDLGTGPVDLTPGSALLLYPDIGHAYRGIDADFCTCWMSFIGTRVEETLKILGLPASGVYEVADSRLLEGRFEEAVALLSTNRTPAGLDASALVYTTILEIYKNLTVGTDSYRGTHDRLQPVFAHIDENFSRPISIEDLANLLDVSSQHFCLIFKKATRMRPTEYINQVRVNKARSLIRQDKDRRLSDIASEVGFDNESYFSYVFKRFEGVSPRAFRDLEGSA